MACAAPTTGGPFLSSVLDFVDCQAQSLGVGGYQSLAAPGSGTGTALTALLTLFIAIFGIRLLLGQRIAIGDLTVAAIKVGVVLTLATSWQAYRPVIYDVVLRAPAELLADIGRPSDLAGSQGGLVARLQGIDDGVIALTLLGSGRLDVSAVPNPNKPAPPASVADDTALGLARVIFLSGTIGAVGFVRIAAGLMLALAPLFAGLLLFEATRGLFLGWVHALVALVLGALAVTLTLAVELALIEPWLSDVLAERTARIATPAAPVELLVMVLGIAVILAGMMWFAARVALSGAARHWSASVNVAGTEHRDAPWVAPLPIAAGNSVAQSRAYLIAESVAATQRREVTMSSTYAAGTMSAAGRVPQSIRDVLPVPARSGSPFANSRRRISGVTLRRNAQP